MVGDVLLRAQLRTRDEVRETEIDQQAATAAAHVNPIAFFRALERAALALLAVPASGLDHSGLVDLYAFEEAESLLRESGDTASALQVAALREERLRELEPKNKAARK